MKNTITLFILLITLFSSYSQTKLDGIAININLPKGWKITNQQYGSVILRHETIPGLILLTEHGYNNKKDLLTSVAEGIQDKNIQLLPSNGVQQLNNGNYYASFSGYAEGQKVRAIGVSTLSKLWQIGGVYIIAMVKEDLYTEAHKNTVLQIANSIQYRTFIDAQAQQWATLIKGKRLVSFNSYYTDTSSNTAYSSVGSSSKTTIHLCSNGQYTIKGSSNFSANGSGIDANNSNASTSSDHGLWSLMNIQNTPVFRLVANDSSVTYYPVEDYQESGALYINGTKWSIGRGILCN